MGNKNYTEENYNEFMLDYSLENLQKMSLEDYIIFCRTLKYTSKKRPFFGNINGFDDIFFGIYQTDKKRNDDKTKFGKYNGVNYAWLSFLGKIPLGDTPNQAYIQIRDQILNIANLAQQIAYTKDDNIKKNLLESIERIDGFAQTFKWKIAFLYSQKNLIDCYSNKKLKNLLLILAPNEKVKTIAEMQYQLIKIKNERPDELAKAFSILWPPKNKNNNKNNEDKTMANTEEPILAQKCAKLLKNTKNLILHGAPGTGKTYLARQIAQQMIFGKVKQELSDEEQKIFNEQVELVQFHPSYDYTDFVEGIRSINNKNTNQTNNDGNNTQIGFDRKDGIFKDFCTKAINKSEHIIKNTTNSNSSSSNHQNLSDCWKALIQEVSEHDENKPLKIGNESYFKTSPEVLKRISNNKKEPYLTFERLKEVYEHKDKNKKYKKYKQQCQNIIDYMSNNYKLENYINEKLEDYVFDEPPEETLNHNENENHFIFIIDEINRGELSKIFGELFFSIDPGYRGKEGAIRTQYANMQNGQNKFDEVLKITDSDNFGHFFVPDNVYIIGTMNDIDRSVESMDLAMRRRFTFKEITAKDSQQTMLTTNNEQHRELSKDTIDKLNNRMTNLNDKITDSEIGLSTDYQIGAAYFLKFADYYNKNDDDEAFNALWNYNLEPLLKEYLRGQDPDDEKFNKLKKAYENDKNPKEQAGEQQQ